MSLATGTITGQASLPAATLELITRLETELTAHAAWDFVKEFTSGATGVVRVWKLLAANSAWDADLFFFLYRDTSSGVFSISASEKFDTATNNVEDFCPGSSVNNINEADWTVGGALAGSKAFSTAASQQHFPNLTMVNTATFDYLLSVTDNHVLVATNVLPSQPAQFAGLHESFMPADKCPLFCGTINNASNLTISYSRALVPVLQNSGYFDATNPGVGSQRFTPVPNTVGVSVDPIAQNRVHFSRYYAAPNQASDTRGRMRGLYRDLLHAPTAGGVVLGDTITVNGETYRYLGQACWVRAAA